jgi:hypothetical protein
MFILFFEVRVAVFRGVRVGEVEPLVQPAVETVAWPVVRDDGDEDEGFGRCMHACAGKDAAGAQQLQGLDLDRFGSGVEVRCEDDRCYTWVR